MKMKKYLISGIVGFVIWMLLITITVITNLKGALFQWIVAIIVLIIVRIIYRHFKNKEDKNVDIQASEYLAHENAYIDPISDIDTNQVISNKNKVIPIISYILTGIVFILMVYALIDHFS